MPKPTFFNLLDEKRRRIAELAIEEFARVPYGQASISRLVDRAGIAKGSFYQYFENKLDLYEWLLFDVIAHHKLTYLRDFGPPPAEGDFFEQLEHMLMGGLAFGLDNPRLSRIASWVMHSVSEPELSHVHARFRRRTHVATRVYLKHALDQGHLRGDIDLDIAADMVAGVLQHGMDSAFLRTVGVDLLEFCARPELRERFPEAEQRRMIHSLVDLLRRGLAPSETPTQPLEMDVERIGREMTQALQESR